MEEYCCQRHIIIKQLASEKNELYYENAALKKEVEKLKSTNTDLPNHIPYKYLRGKKIKAITVYGDSYIKVDDVKEVIKTPNNKQRLPCCEAVNWIKERSEITLNVCPVCGNDV